MASKKDRILDLLQGLCSLMDKNGLISLEAEGVKLIKGRLVAPPPSATIPQDKPKTLSPQERRKLEDSILFGGDDNG